MIDTILSHCTDAYQVLIIFDVMVYILYILISDKTSFIFRMVSLFVIVLVLQSVFYSVCYYYGLKKIAGICITCFSAATWGMILARRDIGFKLFLFLLLVTFLFPYELFK